MSNEMTTEKLYEVLKLHEMWLNGEKGGERANLGEANLAGANLRRANLRGANLTGANLKGADLDFSCLPLWCGGQFKADERICKQLVAHTLRIMELSGQGSEKLRELMSDYKKGWHRENEF